MIISKQISLIDTQAKRLTARKVEVFPPRGTKSSDTFFYREDLNKAYARTYLGVMPQSNLSSTVGAYYTAAAILEAVLISTLLFKLPIRKTSLLYTSTLISKDLILSFRNNLVLIWLASR